MNHLRFPIINFYAHGMALTFHYKKEKRIISWIAILSLLYFILSNFTLDHNIKNKNKDLS